MIRLAIRACYHLAIRPDAWATISAALAPSRELRITGMRALLDIAFSLDGSPFAEADGRVVRPAGSPSVQLFVDREASCGVWNKAKRPLAAWRNQDGALRLSIRRTPRKAGVLVSPLSKPSSLRRGQRYAAIDQVLSCRSGRFHSCLSGSRRPSCERQPTLGAKCQVLAECRIFLKPIERQEMDCSRLLSPRGARSNQLFSEHRKIASGSWSSDRRVHGFKNAPQGLAPFRLVCCRNLVAQYGATGINSAVAQRGRRFRELLAYFCKPAAARNGWISFSDQFGAPDRDNIAAVALTFPNHFPMAVPFRGKFDHNKPTKPLPCQIADRCHLAASDNVGLNLVLSAGDAEVVDPRNRAAEFNHALDQRSARRKHFVIAVACPVAVVVQIGLGGLVYDANASTFHICQEVSARCCLVGTDTEDRFVVGDDVAGGCNVLSHFRYPHRRSLIASGNCYLPRIASLVNMNSSADIITGTRACC